MDFISYMHFCTCAQPLIMNLFQNGTCSKELYYANNAYYFLSQNNIVMVLALNIRVVLSLRRKVSAKNAHTTLAALFVSARLCRLYERSES
jgi:hypothetical protein